MERERGERILIFYFSLFVSFSDLRKLDRVFVGAEGKVDLRDESYA